MWKSTYSHLWIWGRSVIRDTVTWLQQVPDVIDAYALKILLSFLEVTPLCQGVWDDNLLQLAKLKNPLSHLVDSLHQPAAVKSEECHGETLGMCSTCRNLRHQMQAKAVRQEKKALASSEIPSKYAPNVTLSTLQIWRSLLLWHERRVCQHGGSDSCRNKLPNLH